MRTEDISARIQAAETSGEALKVLMGFGPEVKELINATARLDAQEPPLPPNPPMTPEELFETSAHLYYKYGGERFLPITDPEDIKLQEKIQECFRYLARKSRSEGLRCLNAENN